MTPAPLLPKHWLLFYDDALTIASIIDIMPLNTLAACRQVAQYHRCGLERIKGNNGPGYNGFSTQLKPTR